MTEEIYKKALKKLKSINKLTLSASTKKINHSGFDTYRTEYKNQIIPLDGINMIVSGSIENWYSAHHTTEKSFLIIAVHDAEEPNKEYFFTSKQLAKVKPIVRKLIAV